MPSSPGTAERKYEEPRAHALRERYLAAFGGVEIPVPVEAIAEDLLGLRVEQEWGMEYSGMLLPAERRIVLSAAEAPRDEAPLRRFRFTIAHEVGHWVCHVVARGGTDASILPRKGTCRRMRIAQIEREANVFAAELLMPESAVRTAWEKVAPRRGCVCGTLSTCLRRRCSGGSTASDLSDEAPA